MLLTEYNEAETMELFREDGRKEGRKEGALSTLIALARKGLLSIKDAAAQAGLSESAFQEELERR